MWCQPSPCKTGALLLGLLSLTFYFLVINYTPSPTCPDINGNPVQQCYYDLENVSQVIYKQNGEYYEGCYITSLNGSGPNQTLFLFRYVAAVQLTNGYSNFPCSEPYNAYVQYGSFPFCAVIDPRLQQQVPIASQPLPCFVRDQPTAKCTNLPAFSLADCNNNDAVQYVVVPPSPGVQNSVTRLYCGTLSGNPTVDPSIFFSNTSATSTFLGASLPCSDPAANVLFYSNGAYYCGLANTESSNWPIQVLGKPFCS